MADNSYLMHSLLDNIQSLTTVSGIRLFGSVVEHLAFNPEAWVQIPSKSQDFFSLICFALFFVTAFIS